MSSAMNEEEEILLSIFPEEFSKENENTFKVRIDIDPSETKVKSPPTLSFIAQLPPTYPDTPPILHIECTPGDDGDDFDKGERDGMIASLEETIQENLGMAMIFTLVSTCKELAINLLDQRVESIEREKKAVKEAVEREEQKRFEGTKVTPESFLAWNKKFKLDLALRQAEEEEVARKQALKASGSSHGVGAEKKLTGRQLFEGDKTLAQSDLKIGEATDVEFDFSKFDRTTRTRGDDEDEEEEVRHWAAE